MALQPPPTVSAGTDDAKRTVQKIGTVLILSFVLFLPFSGKPFHIDSPVTVYIAEQLLKNPYNPPSDSFGNLLAQWNATELPSTSAFHATPHPPLVSYYLALFIRFFGTGEYIINWVMFPFFAGTLIFFFLLCTQCGVTSRLWGTLIFAVSPALLVNAQNVMYDVPLTMFCIGGFYWMFRSTTLKDAGLAGLFVGCACLVKFTAGTMIFAGIVHFLLKKQWRHLLIFLAVAGAINGIWLFHNLYFFNAWQLTQNGHAHYLAGDIRYRFERMISFLGGSVFFPFFPLLLWWHSRLLRTTGIVAGLLSLIWSLLLITIVHYSLPAALFFWACSFSGSMLSLSLFYAVFTGQFTGNPSPAPVQIRRNYITLGTHTFLQMLGGGFLTLYAVRYTLPFVFVFILFSLYQLEKLWSRPARHIVLRSSLLVSCILSLLLSVGDFQIVNAERLIAKECTKRFPGSTVYYRGRLGYLYYMHKAGAVYASNRSDLSDTGSLVVENCFYEDDAVLIESSRPALRLIDSCSYPIIPLRTIGGYAGFYGNDRLPYALDWSSPERRFRIYQVTGNIPDKPSP